MPLLVIERVLKQVEVVSPSGWGRRSAYGARRNALRASSELARRRREREEVEAFLAEGPTVPRQRDGRSGSPQTPGPPQAISRSGRRR
jgi:hypothetical protein